MNINILEGNFERAKEIGSKILGLMNRGGRWLSDDNDDDEQNCNVNGTFEDKTSNLNTSDRNDNDILMEQLNIR